MNLIKTHIAGVYSIKNSISHDNRGTFSRLFCRIELKELLEGKEISQVNRSITHKSGTIRGMHYQKAPFAEIKIIQCIKGRVYDVALDLRKNSETYLQWASIELGENSFDGFVIPEGCAHGFQTIEENSELIYFHTAPYAPEAEAGVRYDDPELKISWPVPISDISQRDLLHPFIGKNFKGIII